MKVLVTGGCGFLGSHVCELLKERDWEVLSYDNLTKFEYARTGYKTDKARYYNLHFLESIGVPTVIADIKDLKTLTKMANHSDYIVHTAAQPAMTVAIEDPVLDFDVNVKGTLNVLEVARANKTPVALCSTIHVYGNEFNELLTEGFTRLTYPEKSINEECAVMHGTLSPLHTSKRAVELYTQAYIDTYNLPATAFRLTGIYGPRQLGGEDHGWVANFAIKTILGLPMKIFGTDKQVRDILYVKDAAKAFLSWYEAGCPPGIYNIGGGPETTTSIRELLDLLEELTGRRSNAELLPKRLGDLHWFVSDYSKAKETFGWEPEVLPKEGVRELVKWVEENEELFKQALEVEAPRSIA